MKFLIYIILFFSFFSCANQCEIFHGDPNILPVINIYYVTKAEFADIESSYVYGNNGYFQFYNNKITKEILTANIFINKDYFFEGRRHLIREELTQSLGLANDSFTYSDSIFYQGSSIVDDYLVIDKELIQILYRHDIYSGMSKSQVKDVLQDKYSEETIDYFCEIAFGTEYGLDDVIRKWSQNIIINVHGEPTNMDLIELQKVIDDLNYLIDSINIIWE